MIPLARLTTAAPLLLTLAVLGWAGHAIAGRLAATDASPMMLMFLRWSLLIVLLGLGARRQIGRAAPIVRHHLGWLLFMAICFSMFNGMYYWAANHTTAINIGVTQGLMPALILIGAYLYFHERITRLQSGGLALSLIGAVLVISQGNMQALLSFSIDPGIILMLIGCIGYTGYVLGLRNRPALNAFVMMWFITAASLLVTLPFIAIEIALGAMRFPGANGWLLLIYIVLVPAFLSEVFFMRGVDLIGPARSGLYTNLVPIFTALLGIGLLGETLHLYHVAALLLVFGGIALFERSKRQPPPAAPPAAASTPPE